MTEEAKNVLDLLSTAYADSEVKKDPELMSLLVSCGQTLEKTENVSLVAAKLTKALAIYTLAHQNQAPKAVVTLYNQLIPKANYYDGVAKSAQLFPLWF